MIPAPFDYELAESVDHAVQLLGSREDAKLLAGGHSLLPLLRLRFAQPSLLVDIGRIEGLSYVRDAGDRIAIGAGTRHHDVANAPLLQEHCPIVSRAAVLIGDPQVRHCGTVGGSIAHGDAAGDMPTVALALDAELDVVGPDGPRTIAAADFFVGPLTTALGPQDVLTEIRFRKLTGDHGWSYQKFCRRAQDWATVGVAAVVKANGTVSEAAVALANMGATPLRAGAVERALVAGEADAAALADAGTDPPDDTSASANFRRHLARVLTRRALDEALSG